ncbi:MAG: choice-of-anchor Q domain-containing protein, partial [Anaerolineae bacterium]|nr:choice-of-anchor Q domain-containing protein [Anaerolineae bacterium]
LPISGNNIDTDGTCGFPQTFLPTALNLLPLADNTGPTLTHALGLDPRSPAIDAALAGTFIGCPGTDQRNVLRAPTASLCDVGAYEVGPTATSLIIPTRPPGSQPWCNIFESMDITVVWHDRAPGSNMQTFYFKFPEGVGVPGQEPGWDSEKFDIDGGPSEWSFHVTLGELEAVCEYKGYKGRLICENVPMLPGYPNSLRPLSLLLEGCSDPVYNTMADIPGEEIPVGGGATGCLYQGPNDNQASCYDPCPVDPAQYPAC